MVLLHRAAPKCKTCLSNCSARRNRRAVRWHIAIPVVANTISDLPSQRPEVNRPPCVGFPTGLGSLARAFSTNCATPNVGDSEHILATCCTSRIRVSCASQQPRAEREVHRHRVAKAHMQVRPHGSDSGMQVGMETLHRAEGLVRTDRRCDDRRAFAHLLREGPVRTRRRTPLVGDDLVRPVAAAPENPRRPLHSGVDGHLWRHDGGPAAQPVTGVRPVKITNM